MMLCVAEYMRPPDKGDPSAPHFPIRSLTPKYGKKLTYRLGAQPGQARAGLFQRDEVSVAVLPRLEQALVTVPRRVRASQPLVELAHP